MITTHQPARLVFALTAPLALLSACGDPAAEGAAEPDAAPDPQDAFFDALASHCGKAYAGQLVSEDAVDADFADAPMVMHVAQCSDEQIAVPFHIQLIGEDGEPAWDRSRTWLITRTIIPHMNGKTESPLGLRLKHDHRHEDGEPDAVTMYGGDTTTEGSARAQDFPVDDFSIEMFEREDLSASVTNIWTVEVDPAGTDDGVFAYQLKRTVEDGAPVDRLFRVEFDLSEEVEAPPPAWGHGGEDGRD